MNPLSEMAQVGDIVRAKHKTIALPTGQAADLVIHEGTSTYVQEGTLALVIRGDSDANKAIITVLILETLLDVFAQHFEINNHLQ
jgi:hypothetical protein